MKMQCSLFSAILAFTISTVTAAPTSSSSTCSTTGISASEAAAVKNAFTSSKLIPDIISSIDPTIDLSISYGSKAVQLGNTFSTLETPLPPSITFPPEPTPPSPNPKYLLLILDPDVPNPNLPATRILLSGSFVHLLTYDISPETCLTSQNTQTQPQTENTQNGKTLDPYISLAPLSVEPHRYTFLVFRQPEDFEPSVALAADRLALDVEEFAQVNGLVLVGGEFLREGVGSVGDV
ncbi:MAG: hypothetical protein M1812_000693 [Candelaria pacifica]|nr:MAG: hypothetical protein M1812_000693 [Candelaria pacifica]